MSATDSDRKRPPPPEGDDDGGGKRPALAPPDDEEEDTCWLCLDAVHESGLPLRRDCSCRGGSGFAHLPCIVEYAKDWSQRNERADWNKFSEAWMTCAANCHHPFQNNLALDLADELISFVKSKYAGNRLWHLSALYVKLKQVKNHQAINKDICIKILSLLLEYTRETQPPVPKAIYQIEALAYKNLGLAYFREGTKESAGTAVEYFQKRLDIATHLQRPGDVTAAEVDLARAKSKCEGAVFKVNEELLKGMKQAYEDRVKRNGQEAVGTITYGTKYAMHLKNQAFRGIEAERLLTKLAAISNRAHGSDHKITKNTLQQLAKCKERKVLISTQQGDRVFQALRYEDEGEKCVVQGPLLKPRNVEDERTMSIPTKDIVALKWKGTPMICNGLKEETDLNGKIGDVRGKDEASGYYKVHFEEKGLGEHLIQERFLRIVFDLPPVESSLGIDVSPQNGG